MGDTISQDTTWRFMSDYYQTMEKTLTQEYMSKVAKIVNGYEIDAAGWDTKDKRYKPITEKWGRHNYSLTL